MAQLLLSGISVGSLYALIAIGYTMVYGILRLINFAHGDMFMMAGFFMIYIAAIPHMPVWGALILTLALTVILGFLIERCAYKSGIEVGNTTEGIDQLAEIITVETYRQGVDGKVATILIIGKRAIFHYRLA